MPSGVYERTAKHREATVKGLMNMTPKAKRLRLKRMSEAKTGKPLSQTHRAALSKSKVKHGDGFRHFGPQSPYAGLYESWKRMMAGCYDSNNRYYKNWGGRGIRVCLLWHDYLVFKKWALKRGWKPGLVQHRPKHDEDYGPSNSTWLPRGEHSRIHHQMNRDKKK